MCIYIYIIYTWIWQDMQSISDLPCFGQIGLRFLFQGWSEWIYSETCCWRLLQKGKQWCSYGWQCWWYSACSRVHLYLHHFLLMISYPPVYCSGICFPHIIQHIHPMSLISWNCFLGQSNCTTFARPVVVCWIEVPPSLDCQIPRVQILEHEFPHLLGSVYSLQGCGDSSQGWLKKICRIVMHTYFCCIGKRPYFFSDSPATRAPVFHVCRNARKPPSSPTQPLRDFEGI